MLRGLLLKESLSDLSLLEGLHITKIETWQVTNAAAWQPTTWTVVNFEAEESEADQLVERMSRSLKPMWYINASTTELVDVVFQDKVFKYPIGDAEQRAAAQKYGLRAGVPESQLDWGE